MHHEFAIPAGHEAAMTRAVQDRSGMPPAAATRVRRPGSSRQAARRAAALGAVLVAALLAGCGVVSDDTASTLLVTPRKYQFHSCKLLAGNLTGQRKRVQELEALMARAAKDPGGGAIASAAYRNEYLQARGEVKEILAMIDEKNCKAESGWTSDRTVY